MKVMKVIRQEENFVSSDYAELERDFEKQNFSKVSGTGNDCQMSTNGLCTNVV